MDATFDDLCAHLVDPAAGSSGLTIGGDPPISIELEPVEGFQEPS